MPNQEEKEYVVRLQLTRQEADMLQVIVKDWLQQQSLSGALPEEAQPLLKKLGLSEFVNGPELEAIRRATTAPIRTEA